MTTKFEIRIVGRLLDRLKNVGLDAALEYGVAVCGGHPQVKMAVLSSAPEPLKTMLNAACAVKVSRRQLDHDATVTFHAEQVQAKNRVAQSFISNLKSARAVGQAPVFLASLTMADRGQCAASKQELADAIAMRRNCIRSTKVKEVLSCSETELKRWSEDGRLPVMFRRRMPFSTGAGILDVRHWDLRLVEESLQHLAQWREEDTLAKKRKRLAS